MSRADEAERAAIQIMDQRSRMIDQISELMARMLENISQKENAAKESMEKRNRGKETMNRFEIAEKYNEMGKSQPKEFIKWLLENLTEQYRQKVEGKLKQMLEMFSHYDHAQRASERKIHMPWDKTEKMVEPGYYIKQKQAYFESEMNGVLNALGMDNKAYLDPEMINRAHVLEDYINSLCEETYRESSEKSRSIDSRDYLEKNNKMLDSIDFGVADCGFKFTMSGEDVEIVIRPKEEMIKLSKKAGIEGDLPFLLRKEAINKNGVDYFVINASDEVYRDIMVFDMFSSDWKKAREDEKKSRASEQKQDEKKAVSRTEKRPDENRQMRNQRLAGNRQNAARAMNIESLFPENGIGRQF